MEAKLAMCLLLHGMAKGSFRMLGKLFGINHATLYRRIRKSGESLPEPEVGMGIREIPFDEMWHFIGSKKQIRGYPSRGSRGCSAVVILQLSDDFTTR